MTIHIINNVSVTVVSRILEQLFVYFSIHQPTTVYYYRRDYHFHITYLVHGKIHRDSPLLRLLKQILDSGPKSLPLSDTMIDPLFVRTVSLPFTFQGL